MKYTFFLLSLLLISSCSPEMSSEEIQAKVIEVNSKLQTYKMESTMSLESETEMTTINLNIAVSGEVDRENKKLHAITSTSMNLMGIDTEFDQESYIDGETMYFRFNDEWMKSTNSELWEEQDQAEVFAEMIQNGDLTFDGIREIDGVEYYLIDLILENDYLNKFVANTGTTSESPGIEFSNYEITFYINKDNYLIEKTEGEVIVTQTIGETSVEIVMKLNTRVYDANKKVDIEIPEEAFSAKELLV